MKKVETSIFLVFLGAILISFSYGLFLSIPLFIEHIGGNEANTGVALSVSGIGTIAAVLLSKGLFKKISPKFIAALGGGCYFIGSLCFLLVGSAGIYLFISMLIIGIGWGFYFNAAPYTLSLFATEKNRVMLFSYLSAFSVLGTGIAPVFIKQVWGSEINFHCMFFLAALAGLVSLFLFYFVPSKHPSVRAISHKSNSLSYALTGLTIYPIMMVFLGACAFTMMLNFQTTFANSIEMNYAFFYMTYSLAVVLSRFILGKRLMQFNQYHLTIALLVLMTIALVSFLLAQYGIVFYGVSSALFGISYGLVYPTIQAAVVNLSSEEYRADVLSYFSLSYFIGVYLFPLLGGILIVHLGYTSLIVILGCLSAAELALAILLNKKIVKAMR